MRCLFCGKELALLKRLRGGGEFCSEAHRKEYQEQYEQLALARLLQAKPADAANQSLLHPVSAPELPVPQPAVNTVSSELSSRPPAPSVAMIEAAPSPRPALAEADPAPLAGFLGDPVVPAVSSFARAGTLELHNVTTPTLPAAGADPALETSFAPAAPLDLQLSLRALDQHLHARERGMELREFSSPDPRIDLHLQPATGTEPGGEAEAMEISMSPHPPQKANSWLAPPRPFTAIPVQLGEWTRLDFPTIGFAYTDRAAPDRVQKSDSAAALQVAATPVIENAEAAIPDAPTPVQESAPALEPQCEPEPAPPELVTKTLPVTLHGLAASRGKFAQPFAAMASSSDVRIPPSASLPLRPLIVLGPPPAKEVAPVPAAPRPEAVKPQEKPAPSPQPSVVPPPETERAKKPAAAEIPETRTAKAAQAKPIPKKPEVATAPPGVLPASDAAIPSLRIEATESAWSKLSTGVKIGIAAGVIAAIAGIGYLVTRVGNKPAVETPVADRTVSSAAAGVPISGGWIDDWANAAKSKRHVSLLSGSAKLSDYRMEFQAQIESKAIGWIFRGLNPRNYYVAKLETITPGLEPTVALVHFAVVDGQDEPRVVVPLPVKSRVDTTYKIRFDAVGNRFTVWVQDQQIAEWSDSRFGSGGVGFFSDRDEKAAMQGPVNVVALVPKN